MVFAAAEMSVIGPPPTSGVGLMGVPLPSWPWHCAHPLAKILAPSAGTPLPGGKPEPSGCMLMSHPARSAASMGLPRLGPSASTGPALRTNATKTAEVSRLRVNMFDHPRVVDGPACDRVAVLVRNGNNRRDLL